MLLGLVGEEDGRAGRALRNLGITFERVRSEVVRSVGVGEMETRGQIPFKPDAKKLLDVVASHEVSIGHYYIETEDLLLALLSDTNSIASGILARLGADPEKIRSEVERLTPKSPRRKR